MAEDKPASKPSVRTLLKLLFALPVLLVLAIFGVFAWQRAAHRLPSVHRVSSTPFAMIPIGKYTASLFTDGANLRAGPQGDDVIIKFANTNGNPADVGEVTFSLSLQSPDVVVHSIGKVFTTQTLGEYRTTVSPGIAGNWLLKLTVTNSVGGFQATAPVKVL